MIKIWTKNERFIYMLDIITARSRHSLNNQPPNVDTNSIQRGATSKGLEGG